MAGGCAPHHDPSASAPSRAARGTAGVTPAPNSDAPYVLVLGTAPAEALESELASVAEIVSRHHGISDTVKRAHEHVAKAHESIAPFSDGPAKAALDVAAEFSVARDR